MSFGLFLCIAVCYFQKLKYAKNGTMEKARRVEGKEGVTDVTYVPTETG